MDLNKLAFINKEEKNPAKPHKSKQTKLAYKRHKDETYAVSRSHKQHLKNISPKSKTTYRNIRLESNTAFKLQAMQHVTGDHSRSDIISRMLKLVKPIILNNSNKRDKYKHDLKLITKRNEILKELDTRM